MHPVISSTLWKISKSVRSRSKQATLLQETAAKISEESFGCEDRDIGESSRKIDRESQDAATGTLMKAAKRQGHWTLVKTERCRESTRGVNS